MPAIKVDFQALVKSLKDEVLAVEASGDEQREKTRKIQAAGTKFKNALYNDKRRYSGEAGSKKRISINTYNTYLSRARKVFEDLGLRHHLLDRDITRLEQRFPHHELAIKALEGLPPKETRLAKRELEGMLRDGLELRARLAGLDFTKPSAKRRVDELRKEHPAYNGQLTKLLGTDPQQAAIELHQQLDEVEPLLEDLQGLKVNHEVMYALQMEPGTRSAHTEKKERALGVKKRSAVAIHYPNYMQRIHDLLSSPTISTAGGTMFGMGPLTFALCAATGRRPIEVLITGDFRAVGDWRLGFTGQAKKREADDKERIIYCLANSALVLQALRVLRALPQVLGLADDAKKPTETRGQNIVVNGRVAAPLNEYAKQFFGDEHRVLKDTRAIYARICRELWFDRDPRWQHADDDVFFAELLGHEDEKTQMHYKQFKLLDFSVDYRPEQNVRAGRLERLEALDDDMPGMGNGDSAIKLHEAVKGILRDDPATKITQSLISEVSGAYRPLIARYMEHCAEALGIERQDNGRWRQVDEIQVPVLVEVEAAGGDDEDAEVKPRVTFSRVDDLWRAAVLLGDTEVAHSLDADQMTAAREAWSEYEQGGAG